MAGSSADMADVGLTGTALRAGEAEFTEEGLAEAFFPHCFDFDLKQD